MCGFRASLERVATYYPAMRLLAFSDLHCDLSQAAALVSKSEQADVVAAVGDLATVHRGLSRTIGELSAIGCPTLLIPGNNETVDALREAVDDWDSATVLHGESAEVEGIEFFGLGGGIPTTPWGWSFDLDEQEARAALEPCPDGCVLLVHSPPYGHVDSPSGGGHLGSRAIAEAVKEHAPRLVLCGHIHESWGQESTAGPSRIVNLGPWGNLIEL